MTAKCHNKEELNPIAISSESILSIPFWSLHTIIERYGYLFYKRFGRGCEDLGDIPLEAKLE